MEKQEEECSQHYNKELKEAFLLFDRDGDGLIDAEDLRQGLNLTGNKISEDMAKIMLEYASVRNGKMAFEDFKHVIFVTDPAVPSSP